ncbi:ABC transporter ATP-binding protein [Pelagibacterium luteolum]|uniref:ABC-2 type transport system ATP-binding protein n=1 Tax=Pelagibacterium luteolum TaxID=440168 RepID=A0A1G7XYN5_9HYPH|nr:ABC transporter ATP-binding protein [Pelagibacterium luteolum]SDG89294.1 ABC-2 type transport system ATP-binding protein [Pelagibacterium luteolum]
MTEDVDAKGTAISVEGVSQRYGRTLALDNVSLTVSTGSLFALIGPNGAGKSTLIDILCTIRAPLTGRVLLTGLDLARDPRGVRRRIGVIFQNSTLDTRLSVFDNLDFHARVHAMERAERRERIDQMLELVQLSDWRKAPVRSLSGGMKRRLEIARGLLHGPEILFMDEPTAGLDPQSRANIWDYLTTLREKTGITIVVSTHYIDEVASADQVCIIDDGKILVQGTPADLKAAHGTTLLRLQPEGTEGRAAILAAHTQTISLADGNILLRFASLPEAEATLAALRGQISLATLEPPSLESVFLSLTGRALREEAPISGRAKPASGGRRK